MVIPGIFQALEWPLLQVDLPQAPERESHHGTHVVPSHCSLLRHGWAMDALQGLASESMRKMAGGDDRLTFL